MKSHIFKISVIICLILFNTAYSSEAKTLSDLDFSNEMVIISSENGNLLTDAAFDGTNYLITWQQSPQNLPRALLMSPDSTNRLIIEISNTLIVAPFETATGISPLVAYDGINYLVAWTVYVSDQNNDIYGQFVSTSGTLVGTPFVISSASGFQDINDIAFDGNNFLVLWTDERNKDKDVYGQIVSPSGSLVGSEIAISTAAFNQKDPAVAFCVTDYLVVWDDGRRLGAGHGEDIYGQFVTPSGTLKGANFVINQNDYPSDNPICIVSDGTKYFVVWTDEIDGFGSGEWDLAGQFVTPLGNINGAPITINNEDGGQYIPSIAFDGTYFLVAWTDMRNDANKNEQFDTGEGTGSDIYGQFVDISGNLWGSEFAITTAENDQFGVGVYFNNDNFFVAWTDNRDGTHAFPFGDIYGVTISINREVGVKDENQQSTFSLSQNYPNPFNPLTSISYQIPSLSKVSIKVYNIAGQEVVALVNEYKDRGVYNTAWDADNFPSGLYFYKIEANGFRDIKKMLLLK